MSTLDGKTIAESFKDLLQVSNNNVGVDETIRYIEDGEGTRSALAISTNAVMVSGHVTPAEDVTFDIGSVTHRFRDMYLSGNTIYLGDTTFSTQDIQAVKDIQQATVPITTVVSLAESAVQPDDDVSLTGLTLKGDLLPDSNMTRDIGTAANHWMRVHTHDLSAHGDVVVGGEIHGPATLIIDPAAVGDNTGKVVIAGDLQVDGETTTVNSTTMTVSGKTITLAEGATDDTQVDGAGVHVDHVDANITYTSGNDSWNVNKTLIAPTLQSENTVTEQLNVTGNAAVDQIDLTAIEQVKNDQAVAVFIYDTSKDSDGGAWRHRTTHTSWYNEELNTVTRGARREFPAVAVIVAETNQVTIYDGDDPGLSMWMVFEQIGDWRSIVFSCVTFINGKLVIGSGSGYTDICFIKERMSKIHPAAEYTGDYIWNELLYDPPVVVERPGLGIVHNAINDVAMTILPNAPIDDDTGLPVPTIAMATDGGVSVIKHDGTVVSKSETNFRTQGPIALTDDNHLIVNNGNYLVYFDEDLENFSQETDQPYIGNYPTITSYPRSYIDDPRWTKTFVLAQQADISQLTSRACGSSSGLTNLHIDSDHSNSMSNHITTRYNTGWMVDDTKLVTLSDTVSGDIGLDVDPQIVLSDTFETDVNGWTQVDPSGNPNSTFVWNDGHGMGIRATGEGFRWSKPFATIPGVEYSVSFGMLSGSGAGYYVANSDDASSGDWEVIGNDGAVITDTNTYNFTATREITYIVLNTSVIDVYIHFDNLIVEQTTQQIKNGSFDPSINWQTDGWRLNVPGTWTMGNSVAEHTPPEVADGYKAIHQQLTLTPGQSYEVSFDIKNSFSTGAALLKINDGHVDPVTVSDGHYSITRLDSNLASTNRDAQLLPGDIVTTTFTPSAAQVTVGVMAAHDPANYFDVIKNGSFDQGGYEGGSRHWEYGSNWTIAGQGAATTDNTNIGGDRLGRALIQRGRLIPGQRYKISFVVDSFTFEVEDLVAVYASGNDSDLVGGSGGVNNYVIAIVDSTTTPGSTVTGEFVASSPDLYIWTSASVTVGGIKSLTIDNLSVKTTGGSIDNFSIKPTSNLITHGRFTQSYTSDLDFKARYPSWYGEDPDDDTYVFGRASVVNKRLRLHNVGNLTGRLVQEIDTVVGETYTFSCDGYVGTTGGFGLTKTDNKNGDLGADSNYVTSEWTEDRSGEITFVATSTKSYVRIDSGSNNTPDQYSEFDNISVHPAVEDRSVHDNAFTIYGTIQKTPVAPGADLVAYSGFTEESYLEQPYNEDLDFGFEDFCFIGWIKTDLTDNQKIFTRDVDSFNRFQIYSINGGVGLYTQDDGDRSYYISDRFISDGEWHQFCCVRRDGVLEVFVDGVKDMGSSQQATVNVPRYISGPGTSSRIGNTHTYGIDPWDGAITMLRASKGAPNASQIEKIYRDEKALFQDGTQATLYGASDAVTAIAQQDDNLLHVGTDQGKSIFNKLTRIEHHDTPINNVIETNGEFTIEQ